MGKFRKLATAVVALLLLGSSLAEAGAFTGSFYGRGEACWGYLWIRTKTIQWNTDFSACYSSYSIVKDTLEAKPKNYEYVLYKVNHPSKNCSWGYIGLYYYAFSYIDHWTGAGFASEQDFRTFNYRSVISGQAGPPNAVLVCDFLDNNAQVNP